MTKKIIFTDAATTRFEEVQQEFVEKFKNELKNRKRIPGDDSIEITASDIEDLDRSTRIRFLGADSYRTFARDALVKLYLVLGILTFLAGIFYPYLIALASNPIQLALIAMGISMAVASFAVNRLFVRRRAETEINAALERYNARYQTLRRERRVLELDFQAQMERDDDDQTSMRIEHRGT